MRLRRMSKPQGDRNIKITQAGFLGGLNLDVPVGNINETEVAVLENLIPYRNRLESRPGVSLSGSTMPGTGTIHTLKYHSGQEKFILHRGSSVYVSSDYLSTWSVAAVGPIGVSVADADSNILEYTDNCIICQEDRILVLELSNSNYLRHINSDGPNTAFPITSADGDGDYKYRITYTFARYVDDVLVAESHPYRSDTFDETLFTEITMPDEWESEDQISITNYNAPSDTHWTHIRLYRTLDIGVFGRGNSSFQYFHFHTMTFEEAENYTGSGISVFSISSAISAFALHSEGFIQVTSTGHNFLDEDEITIIDTDNYDGVYTIESIVDANNFVIPGTFVADDAKGQAAVEPAFYIYDGAEYGIGASDIIIQSRGDLLRSELLYPISTGQVACLSDGFLFCAVSHNKVIYSQNNEFIGYYYPGGQFVTVNDTVTAMISSPESMIIVCKRSTYRQNSISISSSNYGDINLGEFISVLDKPSLVDDIIGVSQSKTISNVDMYRFMAVCSDNSVRLFDGSAWGVNLAKSKVVSEINKMVDGAQALYNPEGGYLIWYSITDGAVVADRALRVGLSEEYGAGWCQYSGTSYPYPALNKNSVSLFIGSTYQMPRMICVDYSDSNPYWVETYNGPTGSGYSRSNTDIGSVDIACKVRFKDDVGSAKHYFIRHQESHVYLRALDRGSDLPAGLVATLSAYADDSSTPVDTYTDFDVSGDVHFVRDISGKRISIEFSTNKAGFILIEKDGYYAVQDRPTINPSASKEQFYQDELCTDLIVWGTRPDMLVNSANGIEVVVFGDAPSLIDGPDENSDSGIKFED